MANRRVLCHVYLYSLVQYSCVPFTQSSTHVHQLCYTDHKMLIGCAFTRIIHFEFRKAADNKLEGWAGFELPFFTAKVGKLPA